MAKKSSVLTYTIPEVKSIVGRANADFVNYWKRERLFKRNGRSKISRESLDEVMEILSRRVTLQSFKDDLGVRHNSHFSKLKSLPDFIKYFETFDGFRGYFAAKDVSLDRLGGKVDAMYHEIKERELSKDVYKRSVDHVEGIMVSAATTDAAAQRTALVKDGENTRIAFVPGRYERDAEYSSIYDGYTISFKQLWEFTLDNVGWKEMLQRDIGVLRESLWYLALGTDKQVINDLKVEIEEAYNVELGDLFVRDSRIMEEVSSRVFTPYDNNRIPFLLERHDAPLQDAEIYDGLAAMYFELWENTLHRLGEDRMVHKDIDVLSGAVAKLATGVHLEVLNHVKEYAQKGQGVGLNKIS